MIDKLIWQVLISLVIIRILLLVRQFDGDWDPFRVQSELRALLMPSCRGRHQEEVLLHVHLHRSQSHITPSTGTLVSVCECEGTKWRPCTENRCTGGRSERMHSYWIVLPGSLL